MSASEPESSPTPRHSKWDTLPVRYTTINDAYITPPETIESMRAKKRIEPYLRYLELIEMGIEEDRREIELRSLISETRLRLEYWTHRYARFRGLPHIGPQRASRISVVRISLAVLLAMGVFAAWAMSASPIVLGVVGVAAIVIAFFIFRGMNSVTSNDILRWRDCPDCGYRLGDLRPALSVQEMDGLWVGPKACPECGSPWPMIPPPVIRG